MSPNFFLFTSHSTSIFFWHPALLNSTRAANLLKWPFNVWKAGGGFILWLKHSRAAVKGRTVWRVFRRTSRSIFGPVMGLVGFVIHDIYHINCHIEKWWPVAKTEPHIIFTALGERRRPSPSEVLNKHISADQLTSHSNRLVFAGTLAATNNFNYTTFTEIHPRGILNFPTWNLMNTRAGAL